MNILYKCFCMTAEVEVAVPDRLPETDILDWMEIVQECLAADHAKRSPLCQSDKAEYAKIPFDEHGPGIGVKPSLQ